MITKPSYSLTAAIPNWLSIKMMNWLIYTDLFRIILHFHFSRSVRVIKSYRSQNYCHIAICKHARSLHFYCTYFFWNLCSNKISNVLAHCDILNTESWHTMMAQKWMETAVKIGITKGSSRYLTSYFASVLYLQSHSSSCYNKVILWNGTSLTRTVFLVSTWLWIWN